MIFFLLYNLYRDTLGHVCLLSSVRFFILFVKYFYFSVVRHYYFNVSGHRQRLVFICTGDMFGTGSPVRACVEYDEILSKLGIPVAEETHLNLKSLWPHRADVLRATEVDIVSHFSYLEL